MKKTKKILSNNYDYAYVNGNPVSYTDPLGLIRHTAGQWIECGKNCRIRIDKVLDESTGKVTRHLHWECRGDEGACGERGEESHGRTWDSVPKQVKECAVRHGFQGEAPKPDAPTAPKIEVKPPQPWWFIPLLVIPFLLSS